MRKIAFLPNILFDHNGLRVDCGLNEALYNRCWIPHAIVGHGTV